MPLYCNMGKMWRLTIHIFTTYVAPNNEPYSPLNGETVHVLT